MYQNSLYVWWCSCTWEKTMLHLQSTILSLDRDLHRSSLIFEIVWTKRSIKLFELIHQRNSTRCVFLKLGFEIFWSTLGFLDHLSFWNGSTVGLLRLQNFLSRVTWTLWASKNFEGKSTQLLEPTVASLFLSATLKVLL